MAHREERKTKDFIKLFWLLFIAILIVFVEIKYTDAQNDSEENQEESNIPQQLPLATGKWNQFKGFYTPRPIPSNAHFTFASVWASWSAWSYCTNNIQMRVRACNTVRGFSCLGPNRDIRPCGNILRESPNRQRIQQIPHETNPNPQQFELEDPWAEDRREALKQLYEKQIPKREEINNVEKVKRPELFASKNIENIQIKTNENLENKFKNEELSEGKSEEEGSEEENNEEEEENEENRLEEDFKNKSTKTLVEQTTQSKKTQNTTPKTIKTTKITSTTTTTTPSTTTSNFVQKQRQHEQFNSRGVTASPQQQAKYVKEDLKQKINTQQQVILSNLGNDTALALEWMVDGMSKSLEQQPSNSPQIFKNQKNKLIENKKEGSEQEVEEDEENEEEGGEVNEDKVKNRRRPLLHSGELEENVDYGDIISSTSSPSTTSTTTTKYFTTTQIKEEKIKTKNKEKIKLLQNNNIEENKIAGNLNANQRKRLMKELAAAQKLKQRQIDQSKERILQQQQQNQQKQKTKSTAMEQQLTKLKAEMHAMEAVLERMKNTERQEDELDEEKDEEKNKENDNKDKTKIKIEKSENHKRNEGKTEIKNSVKQENQITTKIPNTPKIVLPIKVKNNKNHRHLNNPRPVPILIGDQKIIVSSASIPQISSKKSSLSVEEKKNISNYQLNQQILTTTTSKPLLFMKTSIQRRNNRGSLNNNTNINKKVILTENPGSVWLDGNIPRVGSTAKWSDWNEWGECFCGKQMRSRTCIYEDNSFQSQGCTSGKSYESRPCTSTTEQCPTTIPPIPPSKIQIIPKKEKPSLNILRRTSLSIGPLQIEENIKKENEGQNHQRLSENEILRHRHRLMLAQRHRMLKYKN